MGTILDSNQTMRDDILLVNDLFLSHPSNDDYAAIRPGEGGEPVLPLLDVPLGACQVLLHSNGSYYLAGTVGGYGVKENDGIHLWRSANLKTWDALGRVFDLDRDGLWCASRAIRFRLDSSGGQREVFLKDEPGCEYRAVVSPRLFQIGAEVYITFAMNYGGTGILRSVTGLPEGPYADHARITEDGHSASLFRDVDGSLYYLYGGGRIARLSGDLRETTEPFTELRLGDEYKAHTNIQRAVETGQVGPSGASLVLKDGFYWWFAADTFYRMGRPVRETFVAVSRQLKGPYSRRFLAVPHGGEATLFTDREGGWHAAVSSEDGSSYSRDRFCLVRMRFGKNRHLRPADDVLLEDSPVARTRPLRWQEGAGEWIRDTQIGTGNDGRHYLTGTTKASADHRGIELWSSASLDDFSYLGLVWEAGSDERLWYNEKRNGQVRAFWAPEIHRIRGEWFITFSLQFGGTALLRSLSGRAEGPYGMVGRITEDRIDSSLFQDSDGTAYFVWQDGRIARMKDDMSGLAEEGRLLVDLDGERVGYEGAFLVRMDGRYVLGAASWNGDIRVDGTYDLMCAVSDSLYGPYSARRVAVPHGGHGTLFRSDGGRWYSTLFGNDRTAPFRKRPGIVPVRLDGDGVECVDP